MQTHEETTHVRKLKRGIKNYRRRLNNPAELNAASKSFFFGVTGDKFTSTVRFKVDLGKISKSEKNKMSNIFAQEEIELVKMLKEEESHDLLREMEEFPVPIESLYADERITKGVLGNGICITLDFESNKVRRNIDLSNEKVYEAEDEETIQDDFYRNLHLDLKEIENKYNKPAEEIADVFVKVSGDLTCLIKHFEGEEVPLWTYLEDLALTKPEDSMEYRCLLDTKGREELDKRKQFLLRSDQNNF